MLTNLKNSVRIFYKTAGVIVIYPPHDPGKTDYIQFDYDDRVLIVAPSPDSRPRFTLLVDQHTTVTLTNTTERGISYEPREVKAEATAEVTIGNQKDDRGESQLDEEESSNTGIS